MRDFSDYRPEDITLRLERGGGDQEILDILEDKGVDFEQKKANPNPFRDQSATLYMQVESDGASIEYPLTDTEEIRRLVEEVYG